MGIINHDNVCGTNSTLTAQRIMSFFFQCDRMYSVIIEFYYNFSFFLFPFTFIYLLNTIFLNNFVTIKMKVEIDRWYWNGNKFEPDVVRSIRIDFQFKLRQVRVVNLSINCDDALLIKCFIYSFIFIVDIHEFEFYRPNSKRTKLLTFAAIKCRCSF